MRRILLFAIAALVMAAMVVASVAPVFAQGRGEGPQGPAQGPEGGNPGQLCKHEDRQVGAQDRQPLAFQGTEPEAGFANAPGGVVFTSPGSPFSASNPSPEPCPEHAP